jgi:hypothetical protein
MTPAVLVPDSDFGHRQRHHGQLLLFPVGFSVLLLDFSKARSDAAILIPF